MDRYQPGQRHNVLRDFVQPFTAPITHADYGYLGTRQHGTIFLLTHHP